MAWAIASFKQSLKFFISVHTPLQVTGFEIAGANAPVIPQTPLAESLVGILGVIGSGVFHRLVIAGKVVGLGVPLDFSGGGLLVLLHFCSHSLIRCFSALWNSRVVIERPAANRSSSNWNRISS